MHTAKRTSVSTDFLSDKEYRLAYGLVPRLCVDLVIQQESRILLARRKQKPYIDHWHLPGGRVRLGESVEEAARRIARDELCILVDIVETLDYIEFLTDVGDLGSFHSVSITLLATTRAKTLSRVELSWWSCEPKKVHPTHATFLRKHFWIEERVNEQIS